MTEQDRQRGGTMGESIESKYPIGTRPHIHYIPYLIFISYLVSFIGSFTTVELLHRRHPGISWRSLVQLFACSISFAVVAIWCMHSIGNRAVALGSGEVEIQLHTDFTFTGLSAAVPTMTTFLGLLAADFFYRRNRRAILRYAALFICGCCAGGSVKMMHFLRSMGMLNYHIIRMKYRIAGDMITMGLCLISFGLFFYWGDQWVNSIWRRLTIACFLALAISAMHWITVAGTVYELKGYHSRSVRTRNTNLVVSVGLCLAACVVCFALGFLKHVHEKQLRDRAEHVVLAVAMFDEDGKLLVTPGGLLPCQTITRQSHQRIFDEDFNVRHPVFQWLFQVSRNWGGIVDLIPAMREHLEYTGHVRTGIDILGATNRDFITTDEDTSESYSTTFREMLCVTAQDLATSLGTSLPSLGRLYEDVETTGTLVHTARSSSSNTQEKCPVVFEIATQEADPETGLPNPTPFGRGQLLVLTSKVNMAAANRFQNRGFRFASLSQVGDQLAQSLQISRCNLYDLIGRLQASCERELLIPRNGTYLASFLLKPSPTIQGLDVIVQSTAIDRLPMVELADGKLSAREAKLLSVFNGRTLDECLRIRPNFQEASQDGLFLNNFRGKICELCAECPDVALRQAVFSAQQLDMAHQNEESQAVLFAFCGIKEVYNQSLQSPLLRSTPLSLFNACLRSYPDSPDHAILARKNHGVFSTILFPSMESGERTSPKKRSAWNALFRATTSSSSSKTVASPHIRSDNDPVGDASKNKSSMRTFGGIMVSQDMVISDDVQEGSHEPIEMRELGIRTVACVAETAQPTMADRLLAITTSFRGIPPSVSTKEARRNSFGFQLDNQ